MPNEAEVHEIVDRAIDKVKLKDADLLQLSVSEMAVAFRLARYIEDELEPLGEDWKVDVEYNKMGPSGKTKKYRQTKKLRPDIVVHRRLKLDRSDNLLVIELKKAGNKKGVDEDRDKLDDAVSGVGFFHYQHGLFLTFSPDGAFIPDWAGETALPLAAAP